MRCACLKRGKTYYGVTTLAGTRRPPREPFVNGYTRHPLRNRHHPCTDIFFEKFKIKIRGRFKSISKRN